MVINRVPNFSQSTLRDFQVLLLNLSLNVYNFQMTSSDKDFRFMATNDLMAELQKDSIKLDDDSERKVSLHCVVDKT